MHSAFILAGACAAIVGTLPSPTRHNDDTPPPPPEPEPIEVVELPLPPVATGDCTPELNPKMTGCMTRAEYGEGFAAGGFLPDGKHVITFVNFTGAPAEPEPGSIYQREEVIIIKTDGTMFPNGDPWKCITCGVPTDQQAGRTGHLEYCQAFVDGKRILCGDNIISCGEYDLTSSDCTPERTHINPIRWNITPDGSGEPGTIRELRIHPDNIHLGFSSFAIHGGGLSQFAYFGRLVFNEAPTIGEPLVPRYDLVNVSRLFNPDNKTPLSVDGDQLIYDSKADQVGELRGFSGRGQEVTYIGYPGESSNIDAYAMDLTTGVRRRLTAHPEYIDPIDISFDDQWICVMDTRGSNRQMFMAGMRGIPPVLDLVVSTAASSTRNNHQRRFFQPYLIDRWGDRGDYFGQKINAAGDGVPGGGDVNDPEWNGRADPRFSPDGTQIVYWQDFTTAPACGGPNPLPCYNSTAQGGRHVRIMLATLTSREPKILPPVEPASDAIPWALPYVPGSETPVNPTPPGGSYVLQGQESGFADVTITKEGDVVRSVAISYCNYTDDGINFLNRYENATRVNPSYTLVHVDWFSDLVRSGETYSTKKTSSDGFSLDIDVLTNIFDANGTLTTNIDGVEYLQPANGT